MTISTLDPKPALVVIDLQQGILALPAVHPMGDVVRRTSALADAFVATSLGVESTARQAHELGYHVALAVDAMTDMSADAHANSVARIFPRLGETGTTQEILEQLDAVRT